MKKSSQLWIPLIIGCTSCIISVYVQRNLLMTDKVIYEFYNSFLPTEVASNGLLIFREHFWIYYLMAILSYLVKMFSISFVIYVGFKLNEEGTYPAFNQVLSSVILAGMIFILRDFYKILHFSLEISNFNLKDLEKFEPLSINYFFTGFQEINNIKYFLNGINLFEGLFFISLVIVFREKFNSIDKASIFFLKTYVLSYISFLLFVTYLKLILIP